MLRLSWKWRHLPLVIKRHREIRDLYTFGVFWRPSHMWFLVAVAGGALAPRRRSAAALALPYARDLMRRRGGGLRSRARAASEAPGKIAVDAVELAALAWGSARHRTLFL
jgi:hypothetical protein